MARTRVRVELDPKAVRALSAKDGMLDRAVARAAGKVRDEAKKALYQGVRVRSGKLAQSIYVRRKGAAGGALIYLVGSNLKYAKFQHDGVRGPVVPRRAKVLRFKPAGAGRGGWVFAAQTKGFKGVPFLKIGLGRVYASDYTP